MKQQQKMGWQMHTSPIAAVYRIWLTAGGVYDLLLWMQSSCPLSKLLTATDLVLPVASMFSRASHWPRIPSQLQPIRSPRTHAVNTPMPRGKGYHASSK
jgi:hypothetical protein